ncbi:hypothetical protein CRYUN_Cryun40dG0064800 [Craigia yunnanensis]
MHGYVDHKAGFRREQTVASEKAGGSHGPLRASAHIRVSARFDYQPDICKDYKETEKDWEEAEKARKRNMALGGDDDDEAGVDQSDDDDDDSFPFRIIIQRSFVCNEPTLGIFNTAHKIHRKMAEEGWKIHLSVYLIKGNAVRYQSLGEFCMHFPVRAYPP